MNLLIKLLATGIISLSVLVGGVWIGKSDVQTPVAGSFTPVQASQFTLAGAGVTSSQNTITLTSFKLPDPNKTPIVMSMFGQIGYGVLEPQSSKIENISFTGVTQNANGTAVLTGVSRGLSFYTPFAASSTLSLAHAGGSYLILSNSAAFYGQQFLFSNNVGSSTQQISFSNTAPPLYYPGPGVQGSGSAIASTSEFASVAYVNAISTSGAPNASTVAKGIVQLATGAQAQAGTTNGSTGAALVPPNSLFNSAQSSAIIIPVTNSSGKLAQAFLDLTQSFSPSGIWNFLSNVGIGTSSPYAALSVVSPTPAVFGTIYATSTAATNATSTFDGNIKIGKNASTTNLTISGKCVDCVNPVIVSQGLGNFNGGTPSTASASASCAAGMVLTGGGLNGGSGAATAGLNEQSYPSSATSWAGLVYGGNGSTVASGATVYAICVNP